MQESPSAATLVKEAPSTVRPNTMRRIVVPIAIALVGILLLLYPVITTQISNFEQRQIAQDYTTEVADSSTDEERQEEIASAHRYNQTRATGPILDPWLSRVSQDNAEYQAYLQELDRFSTMGRLTIPGINIDLPIYHGTTTEVLEKGVGHLFGSDLPVGGEGTHSVMTAHTGMPSATLFDNLGDIAEGDAIYMDVSGQKMKYVVDEIQVVLPNETDSLAPEAGKDQITLITCTPYGINTHRLLVTAQRAPLDPAEAEEVFDDNGFVWQWWMIAIIAVVLATIIAMIWWVRRMRKNLETAPAAAEVAGGE